jgi:hypothetical protein
MNSLKHVITLIASAIILQTVIAQQLLPDRVYGTSSYLDTIVKNYSEENAMIFDLNVVNISVQIPVSVHIIMNSKGQAGVSTSDIENSLATANSYFTNIGIRFFIDSLNYVNDYNYGFITQDHNKTELLTLYARKNTINLFLADSIEMNQERSYGFTYFPNVADSNYIFLDKKYAAGKYLTTMLGHFMGLLSTHENGRNAELASENNCDASGDYICDTYADPDLYGQVDTTCTYTGTARDGAGKYYIPTVANIMSNTNDDCKCIFTPLQYKRMYYYFWKYRGRLRS